MEKNSMWLFSPEEVRSRIQFRELFMGSYLRPAPPEEAIHVDPWNPGILEDILHLVHEKNTLVATDIETIAQLCGLYTAKHEMWFTYDRSKVLPRIIVSAIAAHVTTKEYSHALMALGQNINFSVPRFIKRICTNTIPKKRVRQSDVFELYTEWCKVVGEQAVGKREFKRQMINYHIPTGKGYVEKQNGVDYYMIACNMSEEAWKHEPTEKTQTNAGTEGEDSAEPLWDEYRRREEVLCRPLEEGEGRVSQAQIWADATAGDDREYEGPYRGGQKDESDDEEPADEQDIVGAYTRGQDVVVVRRNDEDERSDAPTIEPHRGADIIDKGSAEEPIDEQVQRREEIMIAVRKLPAAERQFMKLMKMTYLINPENMQLDDFTAEWDMAGLPELEYHRQEEAYDFFVEYCRLK